MIIFEILQNSTRQNERNSKIRLMTIFNFVIYFLQVRDVALPAKFCRRDNVGGDATGRTSDSRCSSSGKKETWAREGAQKIHMEATINLVVLLMTVLKERRRFCVTFFGQKILLLSFLVRAAYPNKLSIQEMNVVISSTTQCTQMSFFITLNQFSNIKWLYNV